MGSVYPRRKKLWIRFKGPDGWTQQKTPYHVGEEKKARKLLLDVEANVSAGIKFDPENVSGPVTVAAYARKWLEDRRTLVADSKNDEARLKYHVLPAIGSMRLDEVRPRHLVEMFRALRDANKLAPKSIINVYSTVKALFRDAKMADLLIGDAPTILTKYQLGEAVDKDPEWRATARYSRDELEILISDPRLPIDRRVLYALEGIAGLRLGEAAGLRFRHYDPSLQPLGALLIATSYDKGRTKTKQPRRMPVHPTLAAILAEWKLSDWPRMMGRQPTPDDLIVPLPPEHASRIRVRLAPEGMREKGYCFKRFRDDLGLLGFRHRRGHDLRRTMVSLTREDGARKDILELCTHNPRKTGSSIDVYTTFPWDALCAEVAKLRIQRRTPGNIVALRAAVAATGALDGDSPEPPTPDPPAPPPRSGGPRNRGLARSLATPLATHAADSKGIRGDARWRRRESNPGPEALYSQHYVRVRRFGFRR
jgi:integrase